LRYTTAVAAPIGLYLWRRGRSSGLLALWNVLLLVANALFSSRLALMLALVVYLVLLACLRKDAKVRLRTILMITVLSFAILTLLNSMRNADYYSEAGVLDPVQMNMYQVLTYLGTPFQVSIGSAPAMLTGRFPDNGNAWSALEVLVPTFLGGNRDGLSASGAGRYGYQVDVNPALTTNSAFADTFSAFGWWGLLYVLVGLGVAGILYGHASQYKSVVVAVAGVMGYGIAEVWRIYLFNQGITVYIAIAVTASACVVAATVRLPRAPATTNWPRPRQGYRSRTIW
jgi:hypothetical protein